MKKLILIVSFSLFIITVSILVGILTSPIINYILLSLGKIDVSSNELNNTQIQENFNYMVKYMMGLTFASDFSLPHLKSSTEGIIHFKDVQRLIITIQILCLSSFFTFVITRYKTVEKVKYFRFSFILISVVTSIFIIWAMYDFYHMFETLHKIVFTNDYWIFNPSLDPVIMYLPLNLYLTVLISIFVYTGIFTTITYIIEKKKWQK